MPPFKNILGRKKTKDKEPSKVKTSGLSDQSSQKSPITPSTEQSFHTQSLPSAASTNTTTGPQSPVSAKEVPHQQPPTPSSPNIPNSGANNPESMDVAQDTIMENSHQQAAQPQQHNATHLSNLVHPTPQGKFSSRLLSSPMSFCGNSPLRLRFFS